MTFDELFIKIWAQHWNKPRFLASGWAAKALALYERTIKPAFGKASINDVTAAKVRAWHEGLVATPLQANRALGVLSKMLSFAEQREWRAQGTNVCKLVQPYQEKKRKRFATPEELQKIGEILDREALNNPRAVAFIYLLMFSGARPRSLERATWSELVEVQHASQTFGVLTFDGKSTEATGEQEQVIIPPQVLCLLGKRSKGSILNIKFPKDFWIKVKKEAGCENLQARDLRRTFATVGLSNGVSVGLIGELLNHHSASTTKIYARLMNNQRLEATKAIADRMTLILKGDVK